MASSSSSFNSSSFHVPEIKYDVFISFRGEDTRSSFLSHLVKELEHHQIDAYVDDRLHPGDEISSTLLQAIEEAFISLVILSKRYASSTWCLEELVQIIECRQRHQRTVIPIFYNMVKVQSWRSALKKVANLSGFHYPLKYL